MVEEGGNADGVFAGDRSRPAARCCLVDGGEDAVAPSLGGQRVDRARTRIHQPAGKKTGLKLHFGGYLDPFLETFQCIFGLSELRRGTQAPGMMSDALGSLRAAFRAC